LLVTRLLPLLEDYAEEGMRRIDAARALGELGPGASAAIPAIEAALEREPPPRDSLWADELRAALVRVRGPR
jgi:hypothetical protein